MDSRKKSINSPNVYNRNVYNVTNVYVLDKLIGVHCTHGLNRTGYLICRYLIDVDEMDPEEAIECE